MSGRYDWDISDIDNFSYDAIRELLLFHSVVKVSDDTLMLDNGTELIIIPNEGCGGCSSGWYELHELNGCENIITFVGFNEKEEGGDFSYSIFVYADHQKINLLSVSGDDGNGYYGTGYRIKVKVKEEA